MPAAPLRLMLTRSLTSLTYALCGKVAIL